MKHKSTCFRYKALSLSYPAKIYEPTTFDENSLKSIAIRITELEKEVYGETFRNRIDQLEKSVKYLTNFGKKLK